MAFQDDLVEKIDKKASKKKGRRKKNAASEQPKAKKSIELESVDSVDENGKRIPSFNEGRRTLKDCFAPSCVSVVDEDTLKVGDRYVRNYVMQGYPNRTYVGWLDRLYSYSGDMDTIVMVEPADDRRAAEELTQQITALASQLEIETSKGRISNITKYQNKIAQLEEERAKIELNAESLYRVGIFSNLMCDTKESLDKQAEVLESSLKGQRMNFMPTSLRMMDGFKTALPIMKAYYDDKLRNFNTGAVVGCFPFYDAEICHPDGVFLGVNRYTSTPLYIDFFDKTKVNNTNISVFGRAGSGKSYAVSLLTMRSAIKGVRTAIIDPEGEYRSIVLALGGINIDIKQDSKSFINAFEIDEEMELDENMHPTGKTFVDIKTKISDLLDLISVMAAGEITQEQRSLVSGVLLELYRSFGITSDPKSLYEANAGGYDEKTGEFYSTGKKKRMPTFSDFYDLLVRTVGDSIGNQPLQKLCNQLKMFKKGNPYDLFDCESTVDPTGFGTAPAINFNVSQLEEGVLRPIGMYIAMSYVWEKFVKKNFKIKKRVVCDEAWMLLNKSMNGHEYTAAFLEKCSRRIRKRNAGLLVASQNFLEFVACNEGLSVLSNTAVRIFLKQSETDIDALQDKFKLSDGEKAFLSSSQTGEILIKTDTESTVATIMSSKMEHELLTKKNLVHQQ
jgi:conjugal transfer ATP-binding protein TraC